MSHRVGPRRGVDQGSRQEGSPSPHDLVVVGRPDQLTNTRLEITTMLDYAPPSPSGTKRRQLPNTAHRHLKRSQELLDTTMTAIARFTPALLRVTLGVVYIWFGALKMFGYSPVEQLIAAT